VSVSARIFEAHLYLEYELRMFYYIYAQVYPCRRWECNVPDHVECDIFVSRVIQRCARTLLHMVASGNADDLEVFL
jgi:hypothetical protein